VETWECKILVDEDNPSHYEYVCGKITFKESYYIVLVYGVYSDGSSRRLDDNSWFKSLNSAKRGFKEFWWLGRAKWIKITP